jgi:hypothetical protein
MRRISAAPLMIALALGTGCRLGNHVESQTDSDRTTGFYETKLEEATLATNVSPTEVPLPAGQNPMPIVGEVFGHGIAQLILVDLGTGDGGAVSGDYQKGDPAQQLQFDQDVGKLRIDGFYGPDVALAESVCEHKQEVTIMGDYTKTGPFEVPTPHAVQGRLAFWARVTDKFYPSPGAGASACDATMALFEQCYAAESGCGSSDPTENQRRRARTLELFSPFVDAGVLNPADISRITQLFYHATYH